LHNNHGQDGRATFSPNKRKKEKLAWDEEVRNKKGHRYIVRN
jgi:hypothetical protein